jgi:hypothetical protein
MTTVSVQVYAMHGLANNLYSWEKERRDAKR